MEIVKAGATAMEAIQPKTKSWATAFTSIK